jgi:threonine aldolase
VTDNRTFGKFFVRIWLGLKQNFQMAQSGGRESMEFASDNAVGAHEAILAAVAEANSGSARSYGYDTWTVGAEAALASLFEREVAAFLVMTGTAANALALSTICPSYGTVLCHTEAHINTDECGAVELYSGARLTGLWGDGGKLTAEIVENWLDALIRGEHESKPVALSITQSSELGTVYRLEEIKRLSEVCRNRGLKLHMDGSRFANALATLACSPAEATWKAGVDIMSFGATKNGALMLEAVIFFDPALAQDFRYRRKQAGQLLSKGRFLGAQMSAYLKDGLWLKNAACANGRARFLAQELRRNQSIRIPVETEANGVFAIMPRRLFDALQAKGAHFYEWPGKGPGTDVIEPGECFVRFVTSFRTSEDEVKRLGNLAAELGSQEKGTLG